VGKLSTKDTLIEDVKREVLMDLNQTHWQPRQKQDLVDSIKREVLADLGHPHTPSYASDRAFVESIKNEVLEQIQQETRRGPAAFQGATSSYPDRATVEAVKKEVLSQMKEDQERRGERYPRHGEDS
jgi:hypothetical protein